MSFKLPDLPYAYDALEPHIDKATMEVHHDKHHAGYTKKLNNALEGVDHSDDIIEILQNLNSFPADKQTAIKNNGGGYYNHKIFWENMAPDGASEPSGELKEVINKAFGSFDSFKEKFNEAAKSQFGSGWAWLTIKNGQLEISSTPNQDSPVSEGKNILLALDVWEHAYYLKYQNRRPDYVEAFWNVVNWSEVEKRYENFK